MFGNQAYVDLFTLRNSYPPAPYFQDTEGYQQMKQTLEEKKFLELHGLPGSGKSQCGLKYGEEFSKKYPMSIVWFVDCRDSKRIDNSLFFLYNILLRNNICTNKNLDKDSFLKVMCSDIRRSDIYVFIVFEDVQNQIKPRDKLAAVLEELKHYQKIYILATCRKSGLASADLFSSQKLYGFTDQEAFHYMLGDGDAADPKKKKLLKKLSSDAATCLLE